MSPDLEAKVNELWSRAQISDVIKKYCRAVDRADWDVLRDEVYRPDAQIDHGFFKGDVEGFIDWLRSRHVYIEHSFHLVSNVLIEFYRPDLALVETYGTATQRHMPASDIVESGLTGVQTISTYRYIDQFELGDEGWRITRALLVIGDRWVQTITEPRQFDRLEQRHSTDDILYSLRQEMASKV